MPVYEKLKKLKKKKGKNKKRYKSIHRKQNAASGETITNSMVNRLSELADEEMSAALIEELADCMEIPSPT